MRLDHPSDTAAYVAMGRALAHARAKVPRFDDPFALALLPDDCREAVYRRIDREWPRSRREALLGLIANATETLMGPRTVEIDDALRSLPRGVQIVLLGAGLDARAYRMSELAESIVFEVDHPASQAFKLRQTAAQRWVPEPQRASFSREEMRALLAARGFAVRSDRDGVERARSLGIVPGVAERLGVRFHHVVIADAE